MLKFNCIKKTEEDLPSELENSIFSLTHVVVGNTNFTLLPVSEADNAQSFKLNFLSEDSLNFSLYEDIKIVYNVPAAATSLSKQLVNAALDSDATLALAHFTKKEHSNAIYFYEADNILTIVAVKKGVLHLANRYNVDSLDELFYYIMLVVEQLELSPDSLHVECISTAGVHEEYTKLFKNYLPSIKLTALQHSVNNGDNLEHKDAQQLAAFFSQCVL